MSRTQTAEKETANTILAEADRILTGAAEAGLTLCLTGSVAVYLMCPRHRSALVSLKRRAYHDLDFVGRAADQSRLARFFASLGYLPDPSLIGSQEYGVKRLIFNGPTKVDVFLDEMDMAHCVKFSDRLRSGSPTVSWADLMLSKLQIHELTDNDIKDLIVLIAEHDWSSCPDEDLGYLLTVLTNDWGFWYSATLNLIAVAVFLSHDTLLDGEQRRAVPELVELLRERLLIEPKTLRWRLRSRIGPRVQWYQEVDEVAR